MFYIHYHIEEKDIIKEIKVFQNKCSDNNEKYPIHTQFRTGLKNLNQRNVLYTLSCRK